jgi:hypothetical protein
LLTTKTQLRYRATQRSTGNGVSEGKIKYNPFVKFLCALCVFVFNVLSLCFKDALTFFLKQLTAKGGFVMDDSKMSLVDQFYNVLQYLDDMLISDVGVTLTDREKFLLYKRGKNLKQNLKIQPGLEVKPGMLVHTAMNEDRRIVQRLDNSVWGISTIAVAIPIKNEKGEIIGATSVQQDIDDQDILKATADKLEESITELAGTTEELSAQTEEIATACRTLLNVVQESHNRIKDTDNVLSFIKSVAGQNNLLGLNAAIEAARVGEHGRGFGVVAAEIRKLADNSSESIKKIEITLQSIKDDSINTTQQIEKIDTVITHIAGSISSVASAVQGTTGMIHQLKVLAEKLSHSDK